MHGSQATPSEPERLQANARWCRNSAVERENVSDCQTAAALTIAAALYELAAAYARISGP